MLAGLKTVILFREDVGELCKPTHLHQHSHMKTPPLALVQSEFQPDLVLRVESATRERQFIMQRA